MDVCAARGDPPAEAALAQPGRKPLHHHDDPLHVPRRVPNLHWHDLATRYEHCRVNERALAVIARPSSGCLLIRQHDPATLA